MITQIDLNRVNLVIDYIGNNLNKKLSLDELAGVAAVSKFHFHRIFKEATRETVNQYIKRVKMEKAHRRIRLDPTAHIKELSLQLGYASCSNFSRDFRGYFGFSPKDVKVNTLYSIEWNNDQSNYYPVEFYGIEYLPERHVIYQKIIDGYKREKIVDKFESLYLQAASQNLLVRQAIGIAYDHPDYTAYDKCKYDTCLVVDKPIDRGQDLTCNFKTLKGGRYAVFHFEGKHYQLTQAWQYIFKQWLSDSIYMLYDAPCIEIYTGQINKLQETYKARLYLPVSGARTLADNEI